MRPCANGRSAGAAAAASGAMTQPAAGVGRFTHASPCRKAYAAASVREVTPVLAKMLDSAGPTVFSAIPSAVAMPAVGVARRDQREHLAPLAR